MLCFKGCPSIAFYSLCQKCLHCHLDGAGNSHSCKSQSILLRSAPQAVPYFPAFRCASACRSFMVCYGDKWNHSKPQHRFLCSFCFRHSQIKSSASRHFAVFHGKFITSWCHKSCTILLQVPSNRILFEASLKNSLSPCPLCGSASPDSPPGERQIFPSHIYCHQQ